MALFKIFDIAGSGMNAQSIRLNTTASNIANANSAASNTDEVYRAKKPVFSAVHQGAIDDFDFRFRSQQSPSEGVQVRDIYESEAPLDMRYEPQHPLANEQGYVMYPNVNIVEEMTDMLSASRSFQTNVDVADAAKTMMQRLIQLGQ